MQKTEMYKEKLITVIASMSEEQRKAVYDFWVGLLGSEYSGDQVTDYTPQGKAKKLEESMPSGQVEASSEQESLQKTAAALDRDVTNMFWRPLTGSEFSSKQTELYGLQGKTVEQVKPIGKLAETEKKSVTDLGW